MKRIGFLILSLGVLRLAFVGYNDTRPKNQDMIVI